MVLTTMPVVVLFFSKLLKITVVHLWLFFIEPETFQSRWSLFVLVESTKRISCPTKKLKYLNKPSSKIVNGKINRTFIEGTLIAQYNSLYFSTLLTPTVREHTRVYSSPESV